MWSGIILLLSVIILSLAFKLYIFKFQLFREKIIEGADPGEEITSGESDSNYPPITIESVTTTTIMDRIYEDIDEIDGLVAKIIEEEAKYARGEITLADRNAKRADLDAKIATKKANLNYLNSEYTRLIHNGRIATQAQTEFLSLASDMYRDIQARIAAYEAEQAALEAERLRLKAIRDKEEAERREIEAEENERARLKADRILKRALRLYCPLNWIRSDNRTSEESTGTAIYNVYTTGVGIDDHSSRRLAGKGAMNFAVRNCQVVLPSFDITKNVLSVSFWWYIQAIGTSTPIFCLRPDRDTDNHLSGALQFWSYNSGTMAIWLNGAIPKSNLASREHGPPTPSLYTWHHICMVVDTSNFKYYVDDKLTYESSWSDGYKIPNRTYFYNVLGDEPTRVGYVKYDNSNYGNYHLADFRVYDKALTTTDIANLRANNLTPVKYCKGSYGQYPGWDMVCPSHKPACVGFQENIKWGMCEATSEDRDGIQRCVDSYNPAGDRDPTIKVMCTEFQPNCIGHIGGKRWGTCYHDNWVL